MKSLTPSGFFKVSLFFTLMISSIAQAASFEWYASKRDFTKKPGETGTGSITIDRYSGWTGPVSFSFVGLPTGVVGNITPNPVSTRSASYSIALSKTVPNGTYSFTLRGSAEGLVKDQPFTLTVSSPVISLSAPSVDFGTVNIGETPAGRTITLQNTGTTSLTLTSVNLTGTNAAQFRLTSNTCNGKTIRVGSSCTFTIGALAPTSAKNYFATIGFTSTAPNPPQLPISMTSQVAPDFTMTVDSSALTIVQENSDQINIQVSRTNLTNPINFSLVGAPAGVTATFDPNDTTGNTSIMTLNISSTAVPGSYSMTLGASSGSLVRSSAISLTVDPLPPPPPPPPTGIEASHYEFYMDRRDTSMNNTWSVPGTIDWYSNMAPVQVELRNAPAGLTLSVDQNPVVRTPETVGETRINLTFNANSSVAEGYYTLLVHTQAGNPGALVTSDQPVDIVIDRSISTAGVSGSSPTSSAGISGSAAGSTGSVAGSTGTAGVAGAAAPSSFNFSMPVSTSTQQGRSTSTLPISLNRTNCPNSIAFSVSGAPVGVSANFSPSATTGDSSGMTVNVNSGVATGSYNLSVRASDGTMTQTAPLALTVTAASVAGSSGTAGSAGSLGGAGSTGLGYRNVGMFGSETITSPTLVNQDRYDMKLDQATLTNLYLSPTGNNSNNGLSSSSPIKSLNTAGAIIRTREGCAVDTPCVMTRTGYNIILAPGTYADEQRSHIMDYVQGTAQFPILIHSSTGNRSDVTVQTDLEFDMTSYIYLYDFSIVRPGDVLHFARSHHMLARNMNMNGTGGAHDMFKVNQGQYIYLEDSELQGADDNAVDWVAVQTGRMVGNNIHHANDWCAYAKGGSAYIVVENNNMHHCNTGGFTFGQGTGFEYMVAPWLFYEVTDGKAVNNIIHDVKGAGLGVQGGYNILFAHNTLYKVGDPGYIWGRTQAFEILHGGRECDHDGDSMVSGHCNNNSAAFGWGQPTNSYAVVHIPNKNIFIFNNIIYNPDGYNTVNTVFNVENPFTTMASGSNIPLPSLADDNVVIRGNLIYVHAYAGAELSLFSNSNGCSSSNNTCNNTLVNAFNTVNTIVPQLQDPANGNYKPVSGGNVFSSPIYSVPDFTWDNLPSLSDPAPNAYRVMPTGNLSNSVPVDMTGADRSNINAPGAYTN